MNQELRTARDEAERLKRIDKEPETVLELFAGHPERWNKGRMAQGKSGRHVDVYSRRAISWCLLGAMIRVYKDVGAFTKAMVRTLRFIPGPKEDWNDAPERTFEEVVELCRKAKI